MEKRSKREGTASNDASPDQKTVNNVTGREPLKVEGTTQRGSRRKWGSLGMVIASILAARNAGSAKRVETLSEEASRSAEEAIEETAKVDETILGVTKWIRWLVIPLAILAWAGIGILILWAAGYIAKTILLLVIASLLAYALVPLVTLLGRVMPRFLAILLVYLVVLGGLCALLYFIARTAVNQIISLANYLGLLLNPTGPGGSAPLEHTLNSFGISQAQIEQARSQIIAQAEGLAGNIVPLLTGFVGAALDIILVAVLSIYLLIDGRRATRWLQRNIPRRQRGRVRFLLETLQRVVGGYIRGQLLLCTLIGVLVGAGMGVLGVPYALLLGVLAFVLEFIPILGTLVSGVVCVLLALTKGWVLAVVVLIYFVVVHVIEGDVVGPRIVGRAVGLHPAVSLIALIAGSELFGIWGALFASPIAGVLQAFLVAIWSEWREMHPSEFQSAKDKLAEKVERNVADQPVNSEPTAKLLLGDE